MSIYDRVEVLEELKNPENVAILNAYLENSFKRIEEPAFREVQQNLVDSNTVYNFLKQSDFGEFSKTQRKFENSLKIASSYLKLSLVNNYLEDPFFKQDEAVFLKKELYEKFDSLIEFLDNYSLFQDTVYLNVINSIKELSSKSLIDYVVELDELPLWDEVFRSVFPQRTFAETFFNIRSSYNNHLIASVNYVLSVAEKNNTLYGLVKDLIEKVPNPEDIESVNKTIKIYQVRELDRIYT